MNLPLTFLPPAEWDIVAAYCYYKEEDADLVIRFLEELEELLDRIQFGILLNFIGRLMPRYTG